jgi:SAM-dependent methyltransferase
MSETEHRRINIGCGKRPAPGWLNLDRKRRPGVDVVADLAAGLPFAAASFDYAVTIHVLQDLPLAALVPAVAEIRRILRPGGVFRAALPDLDRAIEAYRRQDRDYFLVPDSEWRSVGAKLVVQAVWHGESRTPFTYDFATELFAKAGFSAMRRAAFRATTSHFPAIAALDNRERESLFVEAEA